MSNSPWKILMDKKNIDGTTYNFSVSDMLYSSMEIPHNKAGKFSF
jgi:hypothetical protein